MQYTQYMINNIQNNLHYYRHTLNISRRDMSDKIGLSARLLHDLECGKVTPTKSMVESLCKFFNVSQKQLISQSKPNPWKI